MKFDLFYLVPALFLLWFPRPLLRAGGRVLGGSRRKQKFTDPLALREPGDLTLRPREEFLKFRNHVDLLRSAAGSYALMCLAFNASAAGDRIVIFRIQAVLLAVGIAIQTLRFRGRLTFFGPVFYLGGTAIGVAGLVPGLGAFALTWVINVLLPGPGPFLFIMAMLVGIIGTLFDGYAMPDLLAAALVGLPVALAVVARQRLSAVSKRI